MMKRMGDMNELNLNNLIMDGILDYIQSIKAIAVVWTILINYYKIILSKKGSKRWIQEPIKC